MILMFSDEISYLCTMLTWSSPRWCMSAKTYRFVADTRFGTDCRSAVRPVRPGDGVCPRTHRARGHAPGATSEDHSHEEKSVPQCQHFAIRRASAHRAKKRWSDSSLQVEDPKASGTPTSLAVTCATFLGLTTVAVAHSIMHHDMSRRRIDALRLGCCSEPQP